MKRREFFERAGLGSAALVSLPFAATAGVATRGETRAGAMQHVPVAGPLATATVSFGQWVATGLDRFPDLGAPGLPNGHQLIPHEVKIRAGGTVNFVIAGFHLVLVYDDGTEPEDIDVTNTIAPTNQPEPPLINDPANRLYRGLDPSRFPQDRVEAVRFPAPGRYLVICGVLPHFVFDGMYGFVSVNP